MGQGGFITLVNGTPYDWVRTRQESSKVKWDFPQTVSAGNSERVYVEWLGDQSDQDVNADVGYELRGAVLEFEIQARAAGRYALQACFKKLATQNNPQGTILTLGWVHDGHVQFVLAGRQDQLVSSNPPVDWMQRNLGWLGDRRLNELCMPGSHDAGMSVRSSGTAFGSNDKTITQSKKIYDQLVAGSRYFDIRPAIHKGKYYAGHYSRIEKWGGATWQGANGQSMEDIIDDVNKFTRTNKELIVLRLSHDLDTDRSNSSYETFDQSQWNKLLRQCQQLENRVKVVRPHSVDLTSMTLKQFIGDGKAAVIVIVDAHRRGIQLGPFAQKGFCLPGNFKVFDDYANTDNVDKMITDQFQKMAEWWQRRENGCFLLSWTLTQQSELWKVAFSKSIAQLANIANPLIYWKLLPECSARKYPNILFIDYVSTSDITALALAINSKVLAGT